jgi:hypothetical protein
VTATQEALFPDLCICGHEAKEHGHRGLCAWCACTSPTAFVSRNPARVCQATPPPIIPTPHHTRQAAGASIRRAAPTLRRKVYEAVRAAGAEGRTSDEVEAATGMSGNTVRPRLLELAEEGRVMRAPRVRPTRSGRLAVVWTVTPAEVGP